MKRACILAGLLLLALAAIVTAQRCGAPGRGHSCVNPALHFDARQSQRAESLQADASARHGRAPLPTPLSFSRTEPQVSDRIASAEDRRYDRGPGHLLPEYRCCAPSARRCRPCSTIDQMRILSYAPPLPSDLHHRPRPQCARFGLRSGGGRGSMRGWVRDTVAAVAAAPPPPAPGIQDSGTGGHDTAAVACAHPNLRYKRTGAV